MRETALSIPNERHRLLLDDAVSYENACSRMTSNIEAKKDKLKEQLGSLEERVAGGSGSFGSMSQTLKGTILNTRNLGEVVDEHGVEFLRLAGRVRDHVESTCGAPRSATWVDRLLSGRLAPSGCQRARAKLTGNTSLIDDDLRGIRRFRATVRDLQAEAELLERSVQGIKQ